MKEFNLKEIVESREKVVAIDWDYVEIKSKEDENKNPNKLPKKEMKRPMSDNFLG
jgi:hypothetical protein